MNSTPPPRPRSALQRSLPRVLISLLIAAGFAWALKQGGLPFAPPAGSGKELQWWAVPGFVVLMLLAFYFRTARWVYMLRPFFEQVSARRTFAVGLVGSGATFFAPLRLGEMVRPYLITVTEPRLKFAQGFGTIAAERAIDGLCIVLLTTLGLAFSTPISPLPDRVGKLPIPVSLVPGALRSATLLFVVALAGMVALYFLRGHVSALVRNVVGRVSPKLAAPLAENLERVAQGLAFAGRLTSALPFGAFTICYWVLSILANWVLLQGIGLDASLSQSCVVLGLLGLGSLLPAGPGFFGAYQVAAYTALAMFYPISQVTSGGAMYVFASYVAHIGINLLVCLLGFALMSGRLDADGHGLSPERKPAELGLERPHE